MQHTKCARDSKAGSKTNQAEDLPAETDDSAGVSATKVIAPVAVPEIISADGGTMSPIYPHLDANQSRTAIATAMALVDVYYEAKRAWRLGRHEEDPTHKAADWHAQTFAHMEALCADAHHASSMVYRGPAVRTPPGLPSRGAASAAASHADHIPPARAEHQHVAKAPKKTRRQPAQTTAPEIAHGGNNNNKEKKYSTPKPVTALSAPADSYKSDPAQRRPRPTSTVAESCCNTPKLTTPRANMPSSHSGPLRFECSFPPAATTNGDEDSADYTTTAQSMRALEQRQYMLMMMMQAQWWSQWCYQQAHVMQALASPPPPSLAPPMNPAAYYAAGPYGNGNRASGMSFTPPTAYTHPYGY